MYRDILTTKPHGAKRYVFIVRRNAWMWEATFFNRRDAEAFAEFHNN